MQTSPAHCAASAAQRKTQPRTFLDFPLTPRGAPFAIRCLSEHGLILAYLAMKR